MPLELINGKLVQVKESKQNLSPSITEEEAIRISSSAETTRRHLPIPEYIPADRREVTAKYLDQLENEIWQTAINTWKKSNDPTAESLITTYESEINHHFLSTDTLIPAEDPQFITENTFAIANEVAVENVVNCTGGTLDGTHSLGFHILGFTQIGNTDQPITPESAAKVEKYIDQIIDVFGEPPEKITLNASTLGKGIDNLDQGHQFVAKTLREKLALKYPEKFPNPEAIVIEMVRSISLTSKRQNT